MTKVTALADTIIVFALCLLSSTQSNASLPEYLNDHLSWVVGLAFSPDGKLLATAGDNYVNVWDTHSWQKKHVLYHPNDVFYVLFSPDG